MKAFSELGITADTKGLVGDKIKIAKILNRQIAVEAYKIVDSKYEGKCLHMQINLNGEHQVVFTASGVLMEMISKVPAEAFPFTTTIVQENERFQFT